MSDFLIETLVWTGALIALVLVLRRPGARLPVRAPERGSGGAVPGGKRYNFISFWGARLEKND